MSVELTEVQKHDFLVDLIQKTYPTIDCDDYSFSWWDIDGGLHIQLNEKDYDRCEECNGEGCDECDNLEEESTEEETLNRHPSCQHGNNFRLMNMTSRMVDCEFGGIDC